MSGIIVTILLLRPLQQLTDWTLEVPHFLLLLSLYPLPLLLDRQLLFPAPLFHHLHLIFVNLTISHSTLPALYQGAIQTSSRRGV
jgi:hypothetical protein